MIEDLQEKNNYCYYKRKININQNIKYFKK